MRVNGRPRSAALAFFVAVLVASATYAQAPGAPPAPPTDESALGTVEVDGSATNTLPPLPKLALVPIPSTSNTDELVSYIVRHDLELSGQFQVQPIKAAPRGPFTRSTPLDLASFRAKGAEFVVRTFVDEGPGTKAHLTAEAFLTPTTATPPNELPDGGTSAPKPAYRGEIDTDIAHARTSAHQLVDELLGALTGKPGGFASEMAFVKRVGVGQRAYVIDADGFNLRASSPEDATAISPDFGPGGLLFYGLSTNYRPFRLAAGNAGTTFPFVLPGSVLGLAFSPDRTKLALTVMDEGRSSIWTAEGGRFTRVDAASHANHPVFGPLGKMAYVGGEPVQRVHINGKPISPAGFMASAPVFCDAPEGLLVIFTVEVAGGSDIVAMDSAGARVRRLTQRQGTNAYPACSPDGRLVAFFSTTTTGKGPGLYVMPVARPWLAQKIAYDVGQSLHWGPRTSRP